MRHICWIYLLVSAMLVAACSESLEDTYSDYAGNGKIRYVGKCTDLRAVAGWHRLELSWTNSTDATIDSIRVTWSATSDVVNDTLLDAGNTSLMLNNMEDGTYRIGLTAIDNRGEESIETTTYARPYTENHEIMKTFTQAITKSYRLDDKLIFFMDSWNENIVDIQLHYTDVDGEKQYVHLDEEVFTGQNVERGNLKADNGFAILSHVNTALDSSIYLTRVGKIAECPDTLRFEPYVLKNEKTVTTDFSSAIQLRYGYSSANPEELNHFLDTVKTLEFDYDFTSFEDILYCPKLEKLILGKNRFMNETYVSAEDYSQLNDVSNRTLNVVKTAEELNGLIVERWGDNHYFNDLESTELNIQDKGFPRLEELGYSYITTIDTITCNMVDESSDGSIENLIDDNPATYWRTSNTGGTIRTLMLTMTLKEQQDIRGVKIVQRQSAEQETKAVIPATIIVKTSVDGLSWEDVTRVENNTLGTSPGEATLLQIAEGSRSVRYIQVTVYDQIAEGGMTTYVTLADIIPYK